MNYTYLVVLFKDGTQSEEADNFFIHRGMTATAHPTPHRAVARRTKVSYEEWEARATEFMDSPEVTFVGIGHHTE